MFRELKITYNDDSQKKLLRLKELLKKTEIKYGIKDRNVKVKYQKDDAKNFMMILKGYDGEEKYTTEKVSEKELKKIFSLIDEMPMRKKEIKGRLYSDDNPKFTLRGTGFANQDKAKKTVKMVKDYPLTYQFQVINTMYNRAKYHPHRTKDMLEAMKVFKKWLDGYKKMRSVIKNN